MEWEWGGRGERLGNGGKREEKDAREREREGEREHSRYADIKEGGLEDRVKWCSIKSVSRAQEKLQRSYCEV